VNEESMKSKTSRQSKDTSAAAKDEIKMITDQKQHSEPLKLDNKPKPDVEIEKSKRNSARRSSRKSVNRQSANIQTNAEDLPSQLAAETRKTGEVEISQGKESSEKENGENSSEAKRKSKRTSDDSGPS